VEEAEYTQSVKEQAIKTSTSNPAQSRRLNPDRTRDPQVQEQ